MNFLSVCSGIEAASVAWNPIGWEAVGFSEIEPFPCAVLKHHYPSVPNFGDMTKFKEWPDATIDVLCGGTPCQSFSVAGLRKGLDDPRGNLMLTFLAIAKRYRPSWVVWENVPGVLSSNGGWDFTTFLDALEELGYICDIEILDAQFFGLAQRRRRVFVCCQHREDLLNQKTDTSALTITQCLQEILQAILIEGSIKLGKEQANSASPIHSRDGAIRRMKLFGLDGEGECWPKLLENLVAAFQRCQQEQKQSDVHLGESEKTHTLVDQLMGFQEEDQFILTEQSLKKVLGEALQVMKLFTTLTETNSITPAQIFSCSKAALLIAKLTQHLSQSSPAFWNSALSNLTSLKEFTNYARSTSSDLFGDMERIQAWHDFIRQAEPTVTTFINFRVKCFGKIFPLSECLQGHPAPSREKGKRIAPTIDASFGRLQGCSGQDANNGHGHLIPSTSMCLNAGGQQRLDAESETLIPTIGGGFDAQAFDWQSGGDSRGLDPKPTAQLQACQVPAVMQPVTYDFFNITAPVNKQNRQPGDPCHTLARSNTEHAVMMQQMQVRRLTPEECEALQGFPRSYTQIPWRKKPASECPDGPRYKALGNSWAVPVARWIGERINKVEAWTS